MAAPLTRPVPLHVVDRSDDLADPIIVDVPSNEIAPGVTLDDGTMHIEHSDGSTTIDFDPKTTEDSTLNQGFYRNLVSEIAEGELSSIASNLLDGIDRDIQSRQEWLETRARGIQLLGLKLEEPRGDMGTASAPLEGMSTVRHHLMLEATVQFQATARGELLPAGGPVKVRNDTPPKSPSQSDNVPTVPTGDAGAGTAPPNLPGSAPAFSVNPAQEAAPFATELAVPSIEERDTLATALEKDFNHYLTVIATEYVPDTDRMLFNVGFSGDGFKKVYNCPLRQRPVSETVDAEDLIVSNSSIDLRSTTRITHRIKMPKSYLKRMQILGVYADVDLMTPQMPKIDPVQQEKGEIEGINLDNKKPEDMNYEIYESYCELELDDYAPEQFKKQGLPLPFRVTIEKTSRKILSIVRNWNEDDDQCLPKRFFVQFPFIRGLGFYGLGYVHLLGNTTITLTAMQREMVDAGMFANFPGAIATRDAGRQLNNQIRVPPGGIALVNAPVGMRVQDSIMPLPYKEPGGPFVAFAQWLEQGGQRLAQIANIAVGEGKQEAPVGTTLALIEQATKILSSVHKRLHWAQNEEFQLLKSRFREDPEAFWRHNSKPSMRWEKEQFLQALEDYNLVPVADPNNPTSLHRMAKAGVLEGLMSKYPQLINQQAALERIFRVAGIDSEGLFYPEPLPPPPDPRMVAIQQKAESVAQTTQTQAQTAMAKALATVILGLKQIEDKQQDRVSKERIQQAQMLLKSMQSDADRQDNRGQIVADQLAKAEEIRAGQIKTMNELQADRAWTQQELAADRARTMQELAAERVKKGQEMRQEAIRGMSDIAANQYTHRTEVERHREQMRMQKERHEQEMQLKREMHEAELEHKRALAAVERKKSASKKKAGGD